MKYMSNLYPSAAVKRNRDTIETLIDTYPGFLVFLAIETLSGLAGEYHN